MKSFNQDLKSSESSESSNEVASNQQIQLYQGGLSERIISQKDILNPDKVEKEQELVYRKDGDKWVREETHKVTTTYLDTPLNREMIKNEVGQVQQNLSSQNVDVEIEGYLQQVDEK